MPYDPRIQSNVAESILQGGRNRVQSLETIADIITGSIAKSDEAKGYRQVLKALAQDPVNGIDPDTIDKMSLGQAKGSIMGAEVRRGQAEARQKQQSQMAFRNAFGSLYRQTQSQPDLTGALMQGRGPIANPPMTPPQLTTTPGNQAILESLNQNLDALNSLEGGAMAGDVLKGLMTQPKQPPQLVDAGGGVQMVWDPTTGRMMQPRTPEPPKVPGTPQPGGPKMSTVNGTKFYSNDKGVTWHPVTTPADESIAGIAARLGVSAPGGDADATKKGNGQPAQGGYEIGAVYNNMTYQGGDPNDEGSWQQ
jgi:ribosomal protein L19E